MQLSQQPRTELAKAWAAVEAMRNAKSPGESEESWKTYLHHIERVWNKAAHHYGRSPRWNGWKAEYERLRKGDPLLAYLVNARGADEHTVGEITACDRGGIGVNPAEGNILHIERMEIRKGSILIESPQGLRVSCLPDRTKLVPVVNRGRTYPVPTSHRGKSVNPLSAIEIAEMGATFYQAFLDEAEKFFVK
jgi:hypothetical protein